MPLQIQLPFQKPELNNFEYLSSYLTICQNTKSTKRSKEAVILCKEIFDNLRNISCSKTIDLPDIHVQLSLEVCGDIHALKSSVPENDGSLIKRLTDSFLCDIMCDGVFEKACQVLLWSYEVRKHIASVNANNEQMSDALEKVTEGKKNNITVEAHENESKLNKTTKTSQSEIVLKNSQTSGKVSSTDVADPLKDENQDNHLPDQALEKSKDHKKQNQLTTPKNIVGYNSNLQENPSDQVKDPRTEDQLQEITENGIVSNNNNELEPAENHNNLVSTGEDKKAKNDLKDASVNLPSNKGSPHSDDQVENNQGSNIPIENEQNNAADNNENIANEETEKINDENDKAKNTIVNNKNETETIAADKDQNTVDIEVADEQTQKQGSENIAIAKNEISSHKSNINNIDENTQNQAKVITTQRNITDKTKNILNDQNPIPIKTEESDQTVAVSEKTSLKVDPKSSPKDTTAPKIPIPNSELLSVATESPSQAPTETTVALEKMEGENDGHQPADKEPDQYTDDLENNGDDEEYSRPDYDGNLYDNTKTRESNPDIPNTVDIPAPKEVVTSQQEKPLEFPSRDSFGQETNDIQMIAAFPEQEDSHFFFYFLSIVLILMAGYLIFHNKQKIIALIVEGRHERNRRSHRAGYKKLETK
ncbi:uncharacterized protein TNCV_4098721 [Trichonephila clavipes]|nr:uncharacterized protein TNCV_4098721 [Trichonephila clavipes]